MFSGKVREVSKQVIESAGILEHKNAVLFEVHAAWKGISENQVIVNTSYGGSDACGNEYEVGRKYLVFANRYDKLPFLQTSTCSLTAEWSGASAVLEQIGQGEKPLVEADYQDDMSRLRYTNAFASVTGAYHRLLKHPYAGFSVAGVLVVGTVLLVVKRRRS
ncbi:hypothetical protein [Paenibacillus sp. FJAT-26967]|uniref:hypothetical protein n=1 Tax=Paenibacillus sp. FJAT-26967 TaxID=1729690 RepID=UPI000838B454|nr:hypothetical protein [Paenibacillus sp. FJAT-26967]